MAIVPNAADQTRSVDRDYCTPNRKNAGTPVAALVPQYLGEIVLDTTGNIEWKAVGLLNTDWIAKTPRP